MNTITRRNLLTASATLVLAGCAAQTPGLPGTDTLEASPGRVIPVRERTIVPDASGTTLDGDHLDISSWRGAPVVVNFWGSWCAPCRAESPDLRRAALETMPLGVHWVGIDVRDDVASAQAFTRAFRIPYPSIFDPNSEIGLGFGAAAPRAIPTTHVLDAKGRIAVQFIGRIYYDSLLPTILQVLSETNPDLKPVHPTNKPSKH